MLVPSFIEVYEVIGSNLEPRPQTTKGSRLINSRSETPYKDIGCCLFIFLLALRVTVYATTGADPGIF